MEQEIQLVTLRMDNIEFAISIDLVREIIRVSDVIKVPKAPVFVEGLINLRGSVVAVIDLRKRLDLPLPNANQDERIIIVEIEDRTLGILVDAVSEVLNISASVIDEVPPTISDVNMKFLSGVAKVDERLIILLDLNKIFSTQELTLLDSVKG